MTELRNVEEEVAFFQGRLLAAAILVLVGFGLLTARLVYLQVYRHEELQTQAEANRITVVPVVPQRGQIVDRNGIVLATNYSAYTLEITPSRLEGGPKALDSVIDELAKVIDVGPRDRRRFKRLLADSKSFESLPLRTKLTDEEVARFTAQRFRFPGVDVNARLFRSYPLGETASHLLGYIGRINPAEKAAMEDWEAEDQDNYKGTDYIGKLGIEQSYESALHGTTGVEQVETSAAGRPVRRLSGHPPKPGDTLVLSVDIKLQALIEELYGDRRGAMVVLDPRSGEVLALVSKPTFDPNLFVDGIDQENWSALNESIDKPLLNRAIRGTYPPGSTYKPFMSIAALNSNSRSPSLVIQDNLSFSFGGRVFGSPETDRAGPKNMTQAIVTSSNVYFYSLAVDMGVDLIHDQLMPFGFGRKTGIDIDGELTGDLPSTEWKRNKFKRPEQKKWYAGETVSLGIGQGYNNFTMLQMATAMATLASGGQRFEPRLGHTLKDSVSGVERPVPRQPLEALKLRPEDVKLVLSAMNGVTLQGTSRAAFAGAAYASGGKTGTAQAVGQNKNTKYNAARIEEALRDHSLYVAFAPVDAPRVALALIVENAGWGAGAAAPIARRVFDYLLAGQWPSAEDIAATREGKTFAPVGKPRDAAEVPLPGQPLPFVAGASAPAASPAVAVPTAAASAASVPAPAVAKTNATRVAAAR